MNQSSDSNLLWKQLTEEFRQACLLRRQGEGARANTILDEELPPMIAAWSKASPSSEAAKREQLNLMFERERQRIEDAWLMQQMMMRQMRDVLIPSLCLQVAEEVREVVAIQIEELSHKLEEIKNPPEKKAPEIPAVPTIVPEPAAGSRIVTLPVRQPEISRVRPDFEDLPAIIDELINRDLGESTMHQRQAVLI